VEGLSVSNTFTLQALLQPVFSLVVVAPIVVTAALAINYVEIL